MRRDRHIFVQRKELSSTELFFPVRKRSVRKWQAVHPSQYDLRRLLCCFGASDTESVHISLFTDMLLQRSIRYPYGRMQSVSAVKRIFDSIAYKDYSVIELAHELNKEKAGSRSWSEESVKKILVNKIYFGTFSRFGVEYPNHTVPIISEELYEVTQLRLKSANKRELRAYLYKGMIVCNNCGNVLVNKCGGKKGGMYLYYRCKYCGGVQVAEKAITNRYIDQFNEVLRHTKYITGLDMLKKRYKEVAELLNEIPESMFAYDLSPKQMSKLYGVTKEEQEKLERCINEILAGFQKADFEYLSFSKKGNSWQLMLNR